MERRKGRKGTQQQQQQQLVTPPLVGDEPVEYHCPSSSDNDDDDVTDRNVRGSGVGNLAEPATAGSSSRGSRSSKRFSSVSDTDTDTDSEEEEGDYDSDEDYVAYGRVDVEAATDAVMQWLRQRLAPSTSDADAAAAEQVQSGDADSDGGGEEQQQQQQQGKGRKQRREAAAAQKTKQQQQGEEAQELPLTRREWGKQEDVVRLCRVERKVEGLAVVGLLHQARLIRLLPPTTTGGASREDTGADDHGDGGGEDDDDDSSSSRGRRRSNNEEEERYEEESDVQEAVQGLDAEDVGQVGVEWVARPQDTARLEEALTQQLGDGSIILARVLPWLRSRLASPSAAAASRNSSSSNGKRKKKAQGLPNGNNNNKKQQQQQEKLSDRGSSGADLPNTLRELLATIEREQWGAITHRVRPNDVLHELELNELVEVEMERSGRLTYNKAKILAEKKAGGNEWKWLLGLLFLILMTLPSWLSSLSSVLAWAS